MSLEKPPYVSPSGYFVGDTLLDYDGAPVVDSAGGIQKFDFSVDLMKALLWQYNDAEKLQALLQEKQDWYNSNQTDFWERWYWDVFNLDTANEFGLSVWAKILEAPFSIGEGQDDPGKPLFGFNDGAVNFANGNFAKSSSRTVTLTLEQKRLIIKLRYMKLVSRGTVADCNRFCKAIFGKDSIAYALDPGDMSNVIYVVGFEIDSATRLILDGLDLMPRPAGVGKKIVDASRSYFGFGEGNMNFGQGTMYA